MRFYVSYNDFLKVFFFGVFFYGCFSKELHLIFGFIVYRYVTFVSHFPIFSWLQWPFDL